MAGEKPHSLIVLVFLLAVSMPAFGQAVTPERRQEADRLITEGRELLEKGRIDDAAERFGRARKMNPFEVLAPFHLAECEVSKAPIGGTRDWAKRAFALLDEAIRVNPEFGGTYFLWGTIGGRLGDHRAAVFGFGNAHRLGYRITDARVGLATGLLYLGADLALTGGAEPDEIVGMLEDARERLLRLKEDPRFVGETRKAFHKMWITSMTELAGMYQRVERGAEAEEILTRLVGLEPEEHMHRFNRGKLYGSEGKFDEALAEYGKALELCDDPEWLDPHPLIAAIHSQRMERELAEKHFKIYLSAHPDDWGALHRLADHHARFGDFQPAVAAFKRCLEIAPGALWVMERLAAILLEAGEEEEAEKWLVLYRALQR